MRIDLLLHRLRFARSRTKAKAMIESGHIRRNGQRVVRANTTAEAGDVLTFPLGPSVMILRLNSLPDRRGPASESQHCYQVLDPQGESNLADGRESRLSAPTKGNTPQ